MTLIDDLQALDLSGVVDSAAARSPPRPSGAELTAVLSGDVGATVLGDVGERARGGARRRREPRERCCRRCWTRCPTSRAIPGLEELDLDEWERAVRSGAEIVGDLVAALGGDLDGVEAACSSGAGRRAGGHARASRSTTMRASASTSSRACDGSSTRSTRGVPTSPAGVRASWRWTSCCRCRARRSRGCTRRCAGMLDGRPRSALPAGPRRRPARGARRRSPWPPQAGDADAVRARAGRARGRRATRRSRACESDLRFAVEHIGCTARAGGARGDHAAASAALTGARSGVLEFLGQLRAELAAARAAVEELDADAGGHSHRPAFWTPSTSASRRC